jgi:leader peptidase (prepilin peptidase)/N-methyltransferase
MELLDLLATHSTLFAIVVALFSLLIGSFLNVVIHRLPKMMEHDWRKQAMEILQIEPSEKHPLPPAKYGLATPRSACPNCQAPITALQNVPVISYLFLRGKCAGCGTKISLRYPTIELATAVLSVVVAAKFGMTWYTAAALFMTWSLIAASISIINFCRIRSHCRWSGWD